MRKNVTSLCACLLTAPIVLLMCGASVFGQEASTPSDAELLKRVEQLSKQMGQLTQKVEALERENKALKTQGGVTHREMDKAIDEAIDKKSRGIWQREIKPLEEPFKGGLFFTGEAVFLNTRLDYTPYTGRIDTLGPVAGLDIRSHAISTREAEYDNMSPGFRLNLGYQFESGWDVAGRFMRFTAEGQHALGNPANDLDNVFCNLLDRSLADDAVLNGLFDDGLCDFAEQSLDLTHYVFDAEFGRSFRPARNLTIRPFAGLRYGKLETESNVIYRNLETLGAASDLDQALIDTTMNMDALGLRIGSDVSWEIGDTGLSLFGKSGVSLLYGWFETSRADAYTNASLSSEYLRRTRATTEGCVPVFDASIGLKYEYKYFHVNVGYMFSAWMNANPTHQILGWDDIDARTSKFNIEREDIAFDGLIFGIGFQF